MHRRGKSKAGRLFEFRGHGRKRLVDNSSMTRRDFLGAAMASVALARDNRPNVRFLSVDDMNDWVGCLRGYPGVQTPNIDKRAKRGVLFSDAHCAAPLRNPSRTALFT